jgi:hypothetical protein
MDNKKIIITDLKNHLKDMVLTQTGINDRGNSFFVCISISQ